MFDLTTGPARELLASRDRVDKETIQRMLADGTVIIDDRRRRSNFFDGRFLAARDLTREQTYFLSRQSDLGRAFGAGIVQGLTVTAGPNSTSISIAAGHGVSNLGELVVLPASLTSDLSNIPEIQRLDVALGISRIPSEPARNRSGLFLIALRPVEFTANPIATYPTSITGDRTIEDGDIIEAVAVTLIPYQDEGADIDLAKRRSRAARDIFVNRAKRGIPDSALPLAMIGLERGIVRWIDPFLVRREVGAEHSDVLGIGFAPRALREAHLLQYDQQLSEIVRQRGAANPRFAASEHFYALPSAGRMPLASIDSTDFTQYYFPPEVDVDLSIVPEDEVVQLLEESRLLPPIDLTLSGDEQESTSVLVLIPVRRAQVEAFKRRLTTVSRVLRAAAPGIVAKRRPIESLRGLVLPFAPLPVIDPQAGIDSVWREALRAASGLWYVRRRNLNAPGIRSFGEEFVTEVELGVRFRDFGLKTYLDRLKASATTAAAADMFRVLASPKFMSSEVLAEGAVRELEAARVRVPPEVPDIGGKLMLDQASVARVSGRFGDPRAGEGINKLTEARAEIKENTRLIRKITNSGAIPELDRVSRLIADKDIAKFAADLVAVARTGAATRVKTFVLAKLEELNR